LIKLIEKIKKRFSSSLRFTLLTALAVSIAFAVVAYILVKFATGFYISSYYTTDENRTERESQYAKQLQDYVTRNDLSSDDVAAISRWARSNRYVYIMIHKDDRLLFESGNMGESDDKAPSVDGGEGSADGSGDNVSDGKEPPAVFPDSGITVELPTREDLIKYAEEKDAHLITMKDANVLVSMADFTEYFYYDIFNISALIVAAAVLVLILMLYFQGVTKRITNLATEVTVVADGAMDHGIARDGEDEIGRLARDVENMRTAMLRTVAKEREAIDANTELITSMSHDLRTPLTVLLGYIDVMKGQSNSPEMQGYIDATEKTALRLKKLSDDLFNYFLVFGGEGAEVQMVDYEATLLLDQMLSEQILLMREQGYELDYENMQGMAEGLEGYHIVTDAPRMKRIFENLFSNILKYADKSAPVSILCRVSECKLLLTITNKVNENATNVESNRIGLKTCQKLARSIGIGFESERQGEYFAVKMSLDATKED